MLRQKLGRLTIGRWSLALLTALVTAIALAACGGGSDETTATTTVAEQDNSEGLYAGPRTPNASKEFIVAGADNSIPTFGQEASAAERESASLALMAYMKAREENDWKAACEYIAPQRIEALKKLAAEKNVVDGDTCAEILTMMNETIAESDRKNTLSGPIVGFRFKSAKGTGFALYHGNDGNDYAVPMFRAENQHHRDWQVTELDPVELER